MGRAARERVPRGVHGEWQPAPDRADPVGLFEEQGTSRVPDLVPIRYGRMLVSPFTFFRGAAFLMAADLANTPRTGLTVQLCGDAHLSNFGIFAAPDRRLVFSLNDFDEILPGPFEWDVKRPGGQLRRCRTRSRLRRRAATCGRRRTPCLGPGCALLQDAATRDIPLAATESTGRLADHTFPCPRDQLSSLAASRRATDYSPS